MFLALNQTILFLPPPSFFFCSLLVLYSAVFDGAAKFNQTWCNNVWLSIATKDDFVGSRGLSFCCFPGTYFDTSTAMVNSHSNGADAFQCEDCPVGFIITSPNTLTTCDPCEPGEYQDEEGQFKCKRCGSGKWSNVKSLTVESGCLDCEAGKYSTPEGADSINACVDCQP